MPPEVVRKLHQGESAQPASIEYREMEAFTVLITSYFLESPTHAANWPGQDHSQDGFAMLP
jgi:hypothetical protein